MFAGHWAEVPFRLQLRQSDNRLDDDHGYGLLATVAESFIGPDTLIRILDILLLLNN